MTRDDIIRMAREAGMFKLFGDPNAPEALTGNMIDRFAALVAQRERDELVVMFLEAHEGAKTSHNYWAVAANKIKERNT